MIATLNPKLRNIVIVMHSVFNLKPAMATTIIMVMVIMMVVVMRIVRKILVLRQWCVKKLVFLLLSLLLLFLLLLIIINWLISFTKHILKVNVNHSVEWPAHGTLHFLLCLPSYSVSWVCGLVQPRASLTSLVCVVGGYEAVLVVVLGVQF